MVKMGVEELTSVGSISNAYAAHGVVEPCPIVPLSKTVNSVVDAVSAISNAREVVAPLLQMVSFA